MRFDLLTIFPEFFAGPFDFGMIRRAKQQGQIEINIHDLRSFTTDKHHIVDDRPFGGDDGMVLKPEPIFRAVETIRQAGEQTAIVLLSPQGCVFRQAEAQRLALAQTVGQLSLALRPAGAVKASATRRIGLADLGEQEAPPRVAQVIQTAAVEVPPAPRHAIVGITRAVERKEYTVRPEIR